MKFSIKDRLMLSNQFKILEALYPDEKENYESHRKALEDGYELHYDSIVKRFLDELPKEECIFVLDVLDMYTSLLVSFNQLENPTELNASLIKFPGFDGNNESMHLAYTVFCIEDLNGFSEIKESKKGDYNSRCQLIPKYRNMLDKWLQIDKSLIYKLSELKILELIEDEKK
jgi:uncharacterized protein YfbU (UPF0304 family)